LLTNKYDYLRGPYQSSSFSADCVRREINEMKRRNVAGSLTAVNVTHDDTTKNEGKKHVVT
jgi:hypothetical protein